MSSAVSPIRANAWSGAAAGRLDFDRDAGGWPNRDASRIVQAAGVRWHVQCLGSGPAVLLLHGAGAATHSWRALAPLLAQHFQVIAPDLPGHGFSVPMTRRQTSLSGMAHGVAALLGSLGVSPALAVGHSAGAAIAVRMGLDGLIAPRAIVSLNGALLPMFGAAGHLFASAARALSLFGAVPRWFARAAARPGAVERMVRNTGSTLDAEGIALYRQLASNPGHVAATLAMMSNWSLDGLERDLPRLRIPLILVTGSSDLTVPPREADRVQAQLPSAERQVIEGVGHLAHEERPHAVRAIVHDVATRHGVLAAASDGAARDGA